MEWYSSSMLVSLLPSPTILLLCIVTACILLSQKRTSTRKLPPAPLALPIIGHFHLLGNLPHQSLSDLSKVHGPLMLLRLGSAPLLVASSPTMARQILQTHDRTFAHRFSSAASNHIFREGRDIAFSPPNSYWKLMRRLLATELGSNKGLQFFKRVRVEEVRALMRSVLAECCSAAAVDANSRTNAPTPQQIRRKMQRTMNDMIMRMMLGKRFSELGGGKQDGGAEGSRILELVEEALDLLGTFDVGDVVPCIAWMDLQGCERRSKRLGGELRAAFEGIINARRLAFRDDGHPPNDYLDVLLQASAASSSDTPVHILEVILDSIIAATDTPAISIEWALVELLLNPEKMRIVQGEIDRVVGRARMIEEEDIERLPFLVACVKETMRLHPPAPLLIPHKNEQACEIMGFHIPANTRTMVNTWAIGRDPKVWENPTEFSPERFLKANMIVDVQGQHFELLPFGSGRRSCPGWRLGLVSLHIILASLLQGFEWSIPSSHHLNTSESFGFNLRISTPLVTCTTARLQRELY